MHIENTAASVRALVADDSVVIQRLLSLVLEQVGVAADFTDNGNKALEKLKSVNYDIVFLDVVMPGLDGYQVCKQIKSDKSTRDIPVIMLTGKDGTFDKIRGKMAGANHYLTKPVNTSEFISVLKQFLPLYPAHASAVKKPVTLTAKTATAKIKSPDKTSSASRLSHAEKIANIRKMMEE